MDNKSKKRKLDSIDQHVVMSDEDLLKKIRMSKNVNTLKSEKKAHKVFTRFLQQCGCDNLEYWFYEKPELDKYLAKFWLGVRKYDMEDNSDDEENTDNSKIDKLYSANTLKNFRYALNRILKEKGHLYDITIKGTSFMRSDEAFKVTLKELKQQGKAEVHSHPEITENGK